MNEICVRCFVSGRVQGVWYRGSAQDKARDLGVRGYARNLVDGRVEVVACGEEDAVEALVRWLNKGPPMARVTGVERQSVDPESCEGLDGFATR